MKKYFWLVLILILGTLLRFYHNLDISLWNDEAFSVLMIRYPWGEMFYRLGLDVHPPMYYIFLRFWHYIFGDSLLSLRGFSVLFSTGSIWAGWLLVKEAFKHEKAALWAALFIAINPFELKYAPEARMYTFGIFFALLAGYCLVRALNSQKQVYEAEQKNLAHFPETIAAKKCMCWSYIGFTLSTIIIIYTHYYLLFTAAALGLYGLMYLYKHHQGSGKKYLPLLTSYLIILISFLPWLKTFLYQLRQVEAGYWIEKMTVWSIPSTFWDMLLGFKRDIGNHNTQIWLIIVTLFSLWVLYRFLKKTQSFHKWLVALAVLAPFAGALLFALLARMRGSDSSVYLDRYFLFACVYFSIALAVWMKEIRIKWLSASFFIAYVILNLTAFGSYWRQLDIKSRPGMAGAANFLKMNVEPSQKIYASTGAVFFNFKYYNQTPVKPLLYTLGEIYTKDIPHYSGRALLSDNDLLPDFKTNVHPGDTVWLIWTDGFYQKKPEVPLNWTQVDQKAYPEVRPNADLSVYVTEYKVN